MSHDYDSPKNECPRCGEDIDQGETGLWRCGCGSNYHYLCDNCGAPHNMEEPVCSDCLNNALTKPD